MRQRQLVLLFVGAWLCAVLMACATADAATQKNDAVLRVGDRAHLELADLDGETHRIEDWAGKVVIVDFWASWCAPCKDAMPFYEELAKTHPDDLVIVGVSVDENIDDLRAALQQRPVSFVILHDVSGEVAERFGVETMPSSYLIDRRGVLRNVHRGFVPSDREPLRAKVEELLASGS